MKAFRKELGLRRKKSRFLVASVALAALILANCGSSSSTSIDSETDSTVSGTELEAVPARELIIVTRVRFIWLLPMKH